MAIELTGEDICKRKVFFAFSSVYGAALVVLLLLLLADYFRGYYSHASTNHEWTDG